MKKVIVINPRGIKGDEEYLKEVSALYKRNDIVCRCIQTSIMRFQMKIFLTSAIVIFSRIAKKWCHLLNVMLCAQLNI